MKITELYMLDYTLSDEQAKVASDIAEQMHPKLKAKDQTIEMLCEALREIADEDYRGNRPRSAVIAHKALAKVEKL